MLQLHCVTFCPPLLLFWWGGFFTGCHLISYMHSPPYSTLVLVKGRVVLCQVPLLQLDHLFFGSYIIIENIIMVIRKLGITEVGKTTICFDNYSVPSPRPAIRALWGGPLGEVFTVHMAPTVLSPTSDGVTISFPDITYTLPSSSHTTKKCPSANSHPNSEIQ